MLLNGDVANRAVPEAEAQAMVADDFDAGDVEPAAAARQS
ncbi:MAG: hypothetical protein QOG56_2165 [Solirubrobacteraceae bacterium]|jgi:hypothetical protein|nr:hypothetical protein [Solirubrobacteraceae bacterium]